MPFVSNRRATFYGLLCIHIVLQMGCIKCVSSREMLMRRDHYFRKAHLRTLARALKQFEQSHGKPCSNSTDDAGSPLLSWRVHLLPYIGKEEKSLYEQFKLDEPWNSVHNLALAGSIPDCYRNPRKNDSSSPKVTRIVVYSAIEVGRLATIHQGNVYPLIYETTMPDAIIWTYPDDTPPAKIVKGTDEADERFCILSDESVGPLPQILGPALNFVPGGVP